jgi:hypothetical protein
MSVNFGRHGFTKLSPAVLVAIFLFVLPSTPNFIKAFKSGWTIEISELGQVCWHRYCKYFWGKIICIFKNRLISTLDEVIYFKGTIFQGYTKCLSLHKIGWRSAEKMSHFFKHASSSVPPRISLDTFISRPKGGGRNLAPIGRS